MINEAAVVERTSEDERWIDRLMAVDVDADLIDLICERLDSFVKWDLLFFFHDNPHTLDTAQNIARYTGRDVEIVKPELDAMVEERLLMADRVGGMTVYTLSGDPAVTEMVERFVKAWQDKEFRIKAIYHLFRSMR